MVKIIMYYYGAKPYNMAYVLLAWSGGTWSRVRQEVLKLDKVTAEMGRLRLFLHMFCGSVSKSTGTISDKAIVGGTALQLLDQGSKCELR